MSPNPYIKPFLRRFLTLLGVSVLVVLAFSEAAYRLMREDTSRAPGIIELAIPAGTAELIAKGQAVPSIPDEMVFVVGDTLVVKNEDNANHTLGPLYIPANSSASLKMEQAENLAYECSFQVSQYLGLTIRPPVTWVSRLQALWYGVPTTLMFLLVYSFAVRPLKPEMPPPGQVGAA